MRFVQPLLAAIAMVAALSAAPVALAQRGAATNSASVIAVNFQRLIANTDVGRDMSGKLQAIGQQMQTELQPDATAMQQEQERVQTATRGMTPDQIRANHTLAAQVETFSQHYDAFRTRQQSMARDMQYTQEVTLNDFNTQITPTVREVMEARHAGIVIDVQAATLVLPAYDATDDVVQRLNQRLRTITVTRQTAPTQQQQAAPAPH